MTSFYRHQHLFCIEGLDDGIDGRAVAERIASIILHVQQAEGKGPWEAFERFLQEMIDPKQRALVDSHLGFAVNRVIQYAYKDAADVLRNGGTFQQAMEHVPTYAEVKQAMGGRLMAGWLETHHTATQEWMKELVPGITQAELDTMPALVLDKAWHRMFEREWFNDVGMPENWAFHTILRENMRELRKDNQLDDEDAVIDALRRSYREFYDVSAGDPDPDVWLVTKAWVEEQLGAQ